MFQVYSKVIQLYVDIFLQIFSTVGYYEILTIVLCALQGILVYLFYI